MSASSIVAGRKHWLVLIAFSILTPLLSHGQNVRYDAPFPSISTTTSTPFLVANIPPNSPTLAVCHSPANQVPCTNYATTYTSVGVACPNGSQDTPQPMPSACQSTGDAQGNIGFWAPAGTYDYTVCVHNECFGPYTITLGGSGGTSITLQTNGINNGSQSTLNLAQGSNVTLTDNGTGTVTIASSGGGGSPGSPSLSVQGNNAGSLGGIPGTVIDFTTGKTNYTLLNSKNFEQVRYADQYIWTQSPAGTVSVGANTVTINGVLGVSGFSSAPGVGGLNQHTTHYLYISTTGTPEAVQITATTCTGVTTGTCTVTFTAANSHSAGYTIGTATAGLEEALVDCMTTAPSTNPQNGCHISGAPFQGAVVANLTLNAPFNIDGFRGSPGPLDIDGNGATLTCNTLGKDCFRVGSLAGTNEPWGAHVHDWTFTPKQGMGRTANGTTIALHTVNAQNTTIDHNHFGPGNATGGSDVFDDIVVIENDQNFTYGPENLMNTGNGPPMKCDATYCGSGLLISALSSGGLGKIFGNDFTMSCQGNGITHLSGNGGALWGNVFQNWAKWGVRIGAGLQNVTWNGNNYFEGAASCVNPDFGVTGYSTNEITYTGAGFLDRMQDQGGGNPPQFSNTGATVFNYYVVGNNGASHTRPIFIGYAQTDGVTNFTVRYLCLPGVTTMDLLRITVTGTGDDAVPIVGVAANTAVATGIVCGGTVGTTTETFAALGSYTPNATSLSPAITYWPTPIMLVANGINSIQYRGQNDWIGSTGQVDGNNALEWEAFITKGSFGTAAQSLAGNFVMGLKRWYTGPGKASGTSAQTGARIFNPNIGNVTGHKGIINFTNQNLQGTSHDTCLFTLYDSNYNKTTATSSHQPTLDTADSCIGISTDKTWFAHMASSGYEWYVNHAPDSGTSDKMQLTGSILRLRVPIQFNGSTSGSAQVSVAAVAGTPNKILLPTATGAANAILQTDGANPQQTSWTLTPSLTSLTLGGGTAVSLIRFATDAPGAITVNAQTCTDRGVAIAGSATTATIQISAAYALDANIVVGPAQAVAGTAHYRICNPTGANITLNAAAAFNISVIQ